MTEYEQFKIKTYLHWNLFLSKEQYPYIGRCYAWAKRPDAAKVTDMYSIERDELFHNILPSWERALRELFGQFWPNFSILGNTEPHLHAHLIPRYPKTLARYGIEFQDPNPGKNYAPYPKKEIPLEILLKIRDDIKSRL